MKYSFKNLSFCFTLVLLGMFSVQGSAQATLNADTVKAQLVKDWQRAKAYTLAYLNTMPADKYGFKAVDSIRSFAQQMLHLSQGTFGLIGAGTGQKSDIGGMIDEKRASAQTRDSVVYYVTSSYDFAIDAITKMDAAKLGEAGPAGRTGPLSRLTWLLKAFEHQTHHRGQATIYIRLLGIRPPNEQLF